MRLIDTLLDAIGIRRTNRVRDLMHKLTELNAEHAAAVEAGDDPAAEKIHARREKLQAEIRAAQATVATAEALEAQKRKDRERKEHEARQRVAAQAFARYRDEAAEFDRIVTEQAAAQWERVEAAYRQAVDTSLAAGDDIRSRNEWQRRLVWDRVFVRLIRRTRRSLPSVAGIGTPSSVAEMSARETRSAPAAHVSMEPSK